MTEHITDKCKIDEATWLMDQAYVKPSHVQRTFMLGYASACSKLDEWQRNGWIGPYVLTNNRGHKVMLRRDDPHA